MTGVVAVLAQRELIRFFRQPHRVIGSLAQPLIFWVFLGSGFTPAFQAPGMEGLSYMEFFYPGVLMMLMLFSSIFSTITLIEDRDQGLLQGVLTAPVPRMAIVLGKVSGGMGIALLQTLILMGAAPLIGLNPGLLGWLLILSACVIASLGFTALGFLIAWNMNSTAGFHSIMMVFLLPMWMLSGALFPLNGAPAWLWTLMIANPVTHALRLVRMPFYDTPTLLFTRPEFILAWGVVLIWALGCLWLSLRRVHHQEQGV
jgi:ABC-2 type transport system permease protein